VIGRDFESGRPARKSQPENGSIPRSIAMQHQQIFVNLPIKDMERSQAFFKSLGYSFNPQFTNEQGAALVLGENLFAMLLVEPFFQTFTQKPVADATKSTEVLVCLSCSSRAEVDDLVRKALAAGAKAPNAPQDHGFMYGHGFEDLDGHIWELAYMEPNAAPPQT
jgi:predicted lactoylglutathione lyase